MIHAELSIQAIWYLDYKKKRDYKIIFYIICNICSITRNYKLCVVSYIILII